MLLAGVIEKAVKRKVSSIVLASAHELSKKSVHNRGLTVFGDPLELRQPFRQVCVGKGRQCKGGRLFRKLHSIPSPSIYPYLDPKYPLFGTIDPCLRVQGGSW